MKVWRKRNIEMRKKKFSNKNPGPASQSQITHLEMNIMSDDAMEMNGRGRRVCTGMIGIESRVVVVIWEMPSHHYRHLKNS